jgi:hypothetical protein
MRSDAVSLLDPNTTEQSDTVTLDEPGCTTPNDVTAAVFDAQPVVSRFVALVTLTEIVVFPDAPRPAGAVAAASASSAASSRERSTDEHAEGVGNLAREAEREASMRPETR